MAEPKPLWAKSLAEALGIWCSENGYLRKIDFAEELKIPPNVWKHISAGDGITGDSDPTVYARLFLKTALPQADPRLIPAKKIFMPKSGQYGEIVRAWTDESYKNWLLTSEAQAIQANLSKRESLLNIQTSPALQQGMLTMEEILLGLIMRGVNEANLEILKLLEASQESLAKIETGIRLLQVSTPLSKKSVFSTKGGFPDSSEIDWLVAQLLDKLHLALSGTSEDRDKMGNLYGKSVGKLLKLINALTYTGDERERAVSGQRFIDNNKGG